MSEFRHFCNFLERSDENKWCQKRHRTQATKELNLLPSSSLRFRQARNWAHIVK